MRNFRIAVAAALIALSLGACTTTNIGSAVSAVTTGFQNPVGKQELATVEASYGAVLTAAVTYRRLCIAKQYVVVGANCRDTVAKMQNANRYAHAQILVARTFVREHPGNVNVSTVIAVAMQAVDAFKSVTPNVGAK